MFHFLPVEALGYFFETNICVKTYERSSNKSKFRPWLVTRQSEKRGRILMFRHNFCNQGSNCLDIMLHVASKKRCNFTMCSYLPPNLLYHQRLPPIHQTILAQTCLEHKIELSTTKTNFPTNTWQMLNAKSIDQTIGEENNIG